ncbi:unnamed protein product [Spirodela intermedia]|uniref:Uncharacterized protein n=1 Tax=Spirodela intermedia TaxID=51605 RepID=A0A7I8JC06_SPIIN|nr:unnamed protein product [Spirodela intermedia]CAA6667650.1 unnamed protein product [Spirodela intermedia]
MEVEYGVKVARPAQELSYDSLETETAFVLLVHLPGERQDRDRGERGTKGADHQRGGRKSTQEHAITRRVRLRREEEIGRFRKVFSIPEDVDLRGIEAEFDEDEEILLVHLPRTRGAVAGARIEERVQEEKAAEEEEEQISPAAVPDEPPQQPVETQGEEETLIPTETEEEEVAIEQGKEDHREEADPTPPSPLPGHGGSLHFQNLHLNPTKLRQRRTQRQSPPPS